MFVHPTWFEGAIFYALWFVIPIILAFIILTIGLTRESETAQGVIILVAILLIIFAIVGSIGIAPVVWHYQYEVPSVQEKIVTVDDWQPTFGKYWGEIGGADDLMLQTRDGELFGNKENFLFGKFDTRDILNKLKPNGTYKIKYYGWREGYNSGVPNILSVEQVIDENNTSRHDISNYMNKRSIIVEDNSW